MSSVTEGPTRRAVLTCAGAVAACALTGCATYGEGAGSAAPPPAPAGSGAGNPATGNPATGNPGAGNPPAGDELAKTAQIPVGGGTIFKDKDVVVTQPQAGTFKAFSATCTHAGCQVTSVANGTINCNCHGSKFKIEDGSVARSPAPGPLAPKGITVDGDRILLA